MNQVIGTEEGGVLGVRSYEMMQTGPPPVRSDIAVPFLPDYSGFISRTGSITQMRFARSTTDSGVFFAGGPTNLIVAHSADGTSAIKYHEANRARYPP